MKIKEVMLLDTQNLRHSQYGTLPLKHPLNIAYEAATVDLKDVNMIDSFHLEKYGEMAVNYNRDLELFPVLKENNRKNNRKRIYISITN